MVASVAQWGRTAEANWFDVVLNGGTKTITVDSDGDTLEWIAGDVIVVKTFLNDMGGGTGPSVVPTSPNLTFSNPVAVGTPGFSTQSGFWFYWAKAATTQTNQTITMTVGTNQINKRAAATVHVVTAADTVVASGGNQTEADFAVTPPEGAVIIYGMNDFNATAAAKTIDAGTGTATKRLDLGDGAQYATVSADWAPVTNVLQNIGLASYAGLDVSHGYLIVSAAAFLLTADESNFGGANAGRWSGGALSGGQYTVTSGGPVFEITFFAQGGTTLTAAVDIVTHSGFTFDPSATLLAGGSFASGSLTSGVPGRLRITGTVPGSGTVAVTLIVGAGIDPGDFGTFTIDNVNVEGPISAVPGLCTLGAPGRI